jgi:hypothetical protein
MDRVISKLHSRHGINHPLDVWSIDNWITAMMEHVPQLRLEKVKDTKGRVIKIHSQENQFERTMNLGAITPLRSQGLLEYPVHDLHIWT